MMELMHGKLPLLGYEAGRLARRRPAADTFCLLTHVLDGATSVNRIVLDDHPDGLAFAIVYAEGPPCLVAWRQGDVFDGEDQPATGVELPWPYEAAFVLDAFGARAVVELQPGRARVLLTVTPVFISPKPLMR